MEHMSDHVATTLDFGPRTGAALFMKRLQTPPNLKADPLTSLAGSKVGDMSLRDPDSGRNLVLGEPLRDEVGDDFFPHAANNSKCCCEPQQHALVQQMLLVAYARSMDLEEIRRIRLRQWIDTDPASKGNVEKWCSHYSKFGEGENNEKTLNPNYIRQMVPKRGAATRNIGEKTARRLERIGRLPRGWLDDERGALDVAETAKSESPDYTVPPPSPNCAEEGQTPTYYPKSIPPLPVHDYPIITPEQIMQGATPQRRFVWVSDDDNMAGGRMPAPRGHHVVIQPRARHMADHVALIRIGDGRPVLRRLSWGGDAMYMVTESGALPPIRLEHGQYEIVGVAVTAYPPPIEVELLEPETPIERSQGERRHSLGRRETDPDADMQRCIDEWRERVTEGAVGSEGQARADAVVGAENSPRVRKSDDAK